MGWTKERAGRDEVVKRQRGPFTTVSDKVVTATKHHRHGDEDWYLYEICNTEGVVEQKIIAVTVWEGGMHKEMDEAMGPYFYGCPVEWFYEVAAKNPGWRSTVRIKAGHEEPPHQCFSDMRTWQDGKHNCQRCDRALGEVAA